MKHLKRFEGIELDMVVRKVYVPSEITNITSIATDEGITLRAYDNYFFEELKDDELNLYFSYDGNIPLERFHAVILEVYDRLEANDMLSTLRTPWYYEENGERKSQMREVDNVMVLNNGLREDIREWSGRHISSIYINCHTH